MQLKITQILIYSFIFLLFFSKGVLFLDPDLGWHIKMGEYILTYGLPKADPFSYTMPTYPFVDHEWLTNIILARLYPLLGQTGLSLLYALMATSALLFVTRLKAGRAIAGIVLLSSSELFYYAGVRPQVESWLLFTLLFLINFNQKLWLKWRFFIPFLIILWVNLHGAFAIGIVLIALKIGLEALQNKHVNWLDFLVLIGSIIGSLLNPYGIRIWWEEWMQFSDPMLRWSISEWQPMAFRLDLIFWLFAVLVTFFLIIYLARIPLLIKVVYFGLFVATIGSIRHAPFFVLVGVRLFPQLIREFYQQIKHNAYSLKIAKRFSDAFLVSCFLVVAISFYFIRTTLISSTEDQAFPKAAIEYLKTHPDNGQIFALYGWGGYLEWKYPQKKVFVDGRMASWRYHQASGESEYAYKEYRDLVYGDKDLNSTFAKYNITQILWSTTNSEDAQQISLWERWLNLKHQDFSQKLAQAGWRPIYQDKVTIIYELPKIKR